MFNKIFFPALVLANTIVAVPSIEAAETNCTQNRVDGTTIPTTASYIYPYPAPKSVVPFYQWENDNGYCGEVSMMQAGLNNGQWMSQFNARLVCGTGLSQSGPGNWCSSHKNLPDYNAQLLIEDPNTGVSGSNPYANAATCLANSRPTNMAANPKDPVAGWQYENSMIGTDIYGMSCTNNQPQYWMSMYPSPVTLQVTVSGLTKDTIYNLYEYDFSVISGNPIGSAAALAVPTGNFNRNASMATYVTQFTATGGTYSPPQTVKRTSDQIVVLRAVPASAP
jgi:hypothetical protein